MTARERRVRQTEPLRIPNGDTPGMCEVYLRNTAGEPTRHSENERTGPAERRVASMTRLRYWIERKLNPIEASDRYGEELVIAKLIVEALRRPTVTEGELAEAMRPCLDDLDDGQTKEDFLMAVAEDCARVAVEKLRIPGVRSVPVIVRSYSDV